MTAKELLKKLMKDWRRDGATVNDKDYYFHIIGFTDDWKHWWHVHNDEVVPGNWALKPVLR